MSCVHTRTHTHTLILQPLCTAKDLGGVEGRGRGGADRSRWGRVFNGRSGEREGGGGREKNKDERKEGGGGEGELPSQRGAHEIHNSNDKKRSMEMGERGTAAIGGSVTLMPSFPLQSILFVCLSRALAHCPSGGVASQSASSFMMYTRRGGGGGRGGAIHRGSSPPRRVCMCGSAQLLRRSGA